MLLAVKFFISYAIPDTPHWVATEMAKIEYRRREIEKQVQIVLLKNKGKMINELIITAR